MTKKLALCGFLLGILFCSGGCSIKSDEQPEPVKSSSASYEETTVVSDTEATAILSKKIIKATSQTPQQSVSSAESSLDDSHALKFPFPFNITNNELNVLVKDLYEESETEEQFYEALNELSFSTQNDFSESDVEVLKHCRKLSVELHCPNDISLFSQLEQLESLSICEGVEAAFVTTEKKYIDDYSFLTSLTNLQELRLINAEIDISLLKGMYRLKSLTIAEGIIKVSEKFELASLDSVCFAYCDFDELDFLSSFDNLNELELMYCHFPKEQIQVLNTLTRLERLDLTNCDLSELTNLLSLDKLKHLNIYTYQKEKYPPESLLCNLPPIETLIVYENEFADLQLEFECEILRYQ